MEKRCEIMSLVFYSVQKKTARISTHVHFCDSRLLDFYHDSTPQYILLLHLLQNALLLNPSSKCTSCVTTFDLLFWFTTDGFFPAIISAFSRKILNTLTRLIPLSIYDLSLVRFSYCEYLLPQKTVSCPPT